MTKFRKIKFKDLRFIPASHEDTKNPGVVKKILFSSNDLPKDVTVQMINWARLQKDKSFALHYHEDMDEIFIILSGKVRYTDLKESVELSKGDAIYTPMKKVHKMTNISPLDVDYIAIGLTRRKGGRTINVQS